MSESVERLHEFTAVNEELGFRVSTHQEVWELGVLWIVDAWTTKWVFRAFGKTQQAALLGLVANMLSPSSSHIPIGERQEVLVWVLNKLRWVY